MYVTSLDVKDNGIRLCIHYTVVVLSRRSFVRVTAEGRGCRVQDTCRRSHFRLVGRLSPFTPFPYEPNVHTFPVSLEERHPRLLRSYCTEVKQDSVQKRSLVFGLSGRTTRRRRWSRRAIYGGEG